MLRNEELRIDVGACGEGTFVRVVHIPTGVSRVKAPLGGEASAQAIARLTAEIKRELEERGVSS